MKRMECFEQLATIVDREMLTVTSDPGRRFPPVSATVVVTDPRPLLRLDLDPASAASRHAATTILTVLSAAQAERIGHGSSGGPALNSRGELVGLVWTGRELSDGSKEVWITPVSAWLQKVKDPESAEQALRGALCSP